MLQKIKKATLKMVWDGKNGVVRIVMLASNKLEQLRLSL